MIEALFESKNYQASKKLMDMTVLRQEAIAANLANAQTPGYKRVDVDGDFESAFKDALQAGRSDQIQRMDAKLAVDKAAPVNDATGNTVDIEKEMVHLSENQIQHQLETRMIGGRLARLRMAIKGGQ
ncbi:MAG: flagellar basal body rod protein FlgB [Limisphaerales bacterium]|jgi:flagellar basal-body rod protein FlgB|nr:flagellar basal body rod protein FlgB [Verrucomicrobiota bacterium]MEC8719508.1 flagellar basal body rod protein FlgB [Verrucomicrobiota bacterium]